MSTYSVPALLVILSISLVAQADVERWVNAAFSYISSLNCSDTKITSEKECDQLLRVDKSSMNVYLAEPTSEGRFQAILPDGSLVRDGSHDCVLVLDPYPKANFGHLVIAFYLDLSVRRYECQRVGGRSLDNDECLVPIVKSRCQNKLGWAFRGVNYHRRCEVDFLPLVFLQSGTPHQHRQRLLCVDLQGFASCPVLRPKNETEQLRCDAIKSNTNRCITNMALDTPCRMFETCDHAVLMSGGWNGQASLPRYFENVKGFYEMLRDYGFRKSNIKVFYANGLPDMIVLNEVVRSVYPSVIKSSMRYHIRKLCQSQMCADSLVLYMSGPTRNDGSSLLWDINNNGRAEGNEVYTIEELMEDLDGCNASQVTIIADQSYSGLIVDEFAYSQSYTNVQVYASGLATEYAWSGEFTKHWINFRHTHTCTGQVQKASERAVRRSNPSKYDGSQGRIQRTIFGAPCDVTAPFTNNELHSYYGCQNVPLSVWLSRQKPKLTTT